jgi:hypothetical protein
MSVDCNGMFQIRTFPAQSSFFFACQCKVQKSLVIKNSDRPHAQFVKKFVIFTQLLLTQLNI